MVKKLEIVLATVIALALGSALGTLGAFGNEEPQTDEAAAVEDPSAPSEALDLGVGEHVLLVVGGSFATREQAEAATDLQVLGDLQGFYVAPANQFGGIEQFLPEVRPTDYLLVSAFRTDRGAWEFVELARSAGASALLTGRVENRGYEYVGLGQEAAPDGSGPLRGPVVGSST